MNNKSRHFEFLRLIIILTLLASCSKGQTKTENKDLSKTEETKQTEPKFDIEFPKTEYKVEITETTDPGLGVSITNMILQGKDKNGPFMYFVAYNAVPNNLKEIIKTDPNSLNIAFQAMLTSSATKLGGTNFIFSEIKYKNYNGMESICKVFDGEGIIKSRVYMVDGNIIMTSAGGKNIDIEVVNKFLNSFRIK
ncbi:MAG: hypothetical protein H6Q19_1108 [Bacteroidetes bacterium]|nr:hypothetical protein [Bacteroidota bacterium]